MPEFTPEFRLECIYTLQAAINRVNHNLNFTRTRSELLQTIAFLTSASNEWLQLNHLQIERDLLQSKNILLTEKQVR